MAIKRLIYPEVDCDQKILEQPNFMFLKGIVLWNIILLLIQGNHWLMFGDLINFQ